jgi:hypothetical protein
LAPENTDLLVVDGHGFQALIRTTFIMATGAENLSGRVKCGIKKVRF